MAGYGLGLAVFFALVAFVLEQGFRDSAEKALQERLQIQVYALLSVAKFTNNNVSLPDNLPDPRFEVPGSGLYAFIVTMPNAVAWQSPSALGVEVSLPQDLVPEQFLMLIDQKKRYVLHYKVFKQDANGQSHAFIITVKEDAH